MKLIDPHVDVADMYRYMNFPVEDFFREGAEAWVTLPKIRQAEIEIIGLTLYFDSSFVESNYYDGVKSFYRFYQELFERQPEAFIRSQVGMIW
jgi:hypothetical protein